MKKLSENIDYKIFGIFEASVSEELMYTLQHLSCPLFSPPMYRYIAAPTPLPPQLERLDSLTPGRPTENISFYFIFSSSARFGFSLLSIVGELWLWLRCRSVSVSPL